MYVLTGPLGFYGESDWTHKGGSPGLEHDYICWDLYWKPLRKQDISDRREQEKQLKRDKNGKANETLLR